MTGSFDYLEGKKICIVFVQVLDETAGRVKLQCFRGRGNVERGHLTVVDSNGSLFPVPASASNNVLPNDGTKILKDADYFVLVKADESIELFSCN